MRTFVLVLALLFCAASQHAEANNLTYPFGVGRGTPAVTGDPQDPVWAKLDEEAARLGPILMDAAGPLWWLELSRPAGQQAWPPATQVRLLWDEKYLYTRFHCVDEETYAPFPGGETGRDKEHFRGDVVEIFLDPVGDSRQFIEIQVSPKGGVLDGVHLLTTEPQSGPDGTLLPEVVSRNAWYFPEWNLPGLRVATGTFNNYYGDTPRNKPLGWLVDIAIPAEVLRRLGKKEFSPMTLRANFVRYDQKLKPDGTRETLMSTWAEVPFGRPHRAPQAMNYLKLQ